MKDYYKILGLKPGADVESIRKAYRNLAKVYHPDLNSSVQANDFFILLNEAHEVLTDEAQRIPYDQQYLAWSASKGNAERFHYDWQSIYRMQYPRTRKPNPPGQLLQVIFGIEMFIGFTEALLILGYIFSGPVHPVYGVVAIPGILLVIDGWKGILGRKSALGGIIRVFRRII
ncbi:MAG TPA: DnaJ domain-containing protein [Bacteroidia bacterium]|jgi:hypothetical protein|nr:DnaJ domain-containing protein [Bacteroidia bacterium]